MTGSLRKILQTTANTPEEKFRVLDARDKLYKISKYEKKIKNCKELVCDC